MYMVDCIKCLYTASNCFVSKNQFCNVPLNLNLFKTQNEFSSSILILCGVWFQLFVTFVTLEQPDKTDSWIYINTLLFVTTLNNKRWRCGWRLECKQRTWWYTNMMEIGSTPLRTARPRKQKYQVSWITYVHHTTSTLLSKLSATAKSCMETTPSLVLVVIFRQDTAGFSETVHLLEADNQERSRLFAPRTTIQGKTDPFVPRGLPSLTKKLNWRRFLILLFSLIGLIFQNINYASFCADFQIKVQISSMTYTDL